MSVGIAARNSNDNIGTLITIADTALIQAKNMGPGNIEVIEQTA